MSRLHSNPLRETGSGWKEKQLLLLLLLLLSSLKPAFARKSVFFFKAENLFKSLLLFSDYLFFKKRGVGGEGQNQYKPIITSHLWKHPEWLSKILRHIQAHFSRADIYQKSFAPKQMLSFIVLLSQMTKIYDRQ